MESRKSRWLHDPTQLMIAASYSKDMLVRLAQEFRRCKDPEDDHVSELMLQSILEKNGVNKSYAGRFYYAFNRSRSGKVDEKEFCMGITAMDVSAINMSVKSDSSSLSRTMWKKERARYIFDAYDVDNDGYWSKDDSRHFVRHLRRARGMSCEAAAVQQEVDDIFNAVFQGKPMVSFEEFRVAVLKNRLPGTWSLFRLPSDCSLLQRIRYGQLMDTVASNVETLAETLSDYEQSRKQNVSDMQLSTWDDETPQDSDLLHTHILMATVNSVAAARTVKWHRSAALVRIRRYVMPEVEVTLDSGSMVAKRAVDSNRVRVFQMLSSTISSAIPDERKAFVEACFDKLISAHRMTANSASQREWAASPISFEDAATIIELAAPLICAEPGILRVSAPVRAFGDIHGQYSDLMDYFSAVGSPFDWLPNGDILHMSYLFLGDIVDRGKQSIECLFLLLLLKVKYPKRIFIIRGNHEDPSVNCNFGFLDECIGRFGSNGRQLFRMVNEKIFSRLSIAAVIDDSILCVHGGIGRIQDMGTVHTVATRCKRGAFIADIEEDPLLKAALMDILWSDPTDTEEECGIRPSPRGDSVVSFGSDVSERFLENSGLQMILRAHQCTSDGVDFSANGRVVTVFSATGYMNTHDNHGAVLEICPGEAGALILQAKIIHCEASSEPSPSVGAINGRIMCGVPPMSLPLDEADLMWQMSSDRPPSPLRVSRHPHSCKT